MAEIDHSDNIARLAHLTTNARRLDLTAAFLRHYGPVVQAGPFAGMTLSRRVSWGDGDLLPKLLGSYESELHGFITECISRRPDLVVNVGAAEGYYAVGMARALPDAHVVAYDSSAAAQDICRETAALNQADARVAVGSTCSPETLQRDLAGATMPLLICDCEGYEKTLIDPAQVPALARTALLVECHDFLDRTITGTLVDRLQASHALASITESARDPNAIPFLTPLQSLDRWLAVCESRPCTMHWLLAAPK